MGSGLLLALALSIDGFGVGLSYGLRRIRLPISSLSVIALCTILAMGVSMALGNLIRIWVDFFPIQLLGAAMILVLGIFQVVRALKHRWRQAQDAVDPGEEAAVPAFAALSVPLDDEPLARIQLRYLGLVIQVLRTPDLADMDGSGVITFYESILLGVALAMDALVSGAGAAMAGMEWPIVFFVALIQVLMIKSGQWLAHKTPRRLMEAAEFLPGAVLMLVGIGKMI
ncbi:MAG: manganese efflux pump [Peptococcaceae bacterium]|jgi:putative sporulation protein YtaF|nr:manganese efflux pump [Peptococcaceae bacterium]